MKTLIELRENLPTKVIIEHFISNHPNVIQLESMIHEGYLNVIHKLEETINSIIQNEIDFEDKDGYESSYLLRMKMLVRTKEILKGCTL